MDRLFDLAFVRPPTENYVHCVSTNPEKNLIDVNLARQQHREYVSILRECGIEVIELPPLKDFPDSVFMQDPAVLGTTRAVFGRFGEQKRAGEERIFAGELSEYRNVVGEMFYVNAPGTLEGGDVIVTDHGLFVGGSSRTNLEGSRQLAAYLPGLTVTAITTSLFHLLCGCAYLTERDMIIADEIVDPGSFPNFHFIAIPKEEIYACDALYLGQRRVMIPSGFPRTAMKLKQAGYKPIEIEVSEFHKGDGGVTCLSSPVYKLL
jgi:dimethylargininase